MKLEIPPGEFAGYIFDLDGTLVDSMPLHYQAWSKAMQRAGLSGPLDEDYFYALGGLPTRQVALLLGKHYGLAIDPERVFHDKERIFAESQPEVQVIEPVAAIARRLAKTHPLAVASGGPRDIVRRSLELAGLAPLFRVVVTPEDVVHGKPAPDLFLLAAKRLGVPPQDCLVFEDAAPGIEAAQAAGMRWVLVPSRAGRP